MTRKEDSECLGHVDAGAFEDHAFGLLDQDAAGQGLGELLVDELGLGGGTVLNDADSGQVGEGLDDEDIFFVHRGWLEPEQVQRADDPLPESQREREHGLEACLECDHREPWPGAGAGAEAFVSDPLTRAESVQTWAFLGL